MGNKNIANFTKDFYKLSIQVSLNGLSFCIVDSIANTIINSDARSFDRERSPYELQKSLVSLFAKHDIVNKQFSEVTVIHKNKLFSLVPKPLFEEDEMANYLKFNTKILANDHIAYDVLERYDMVNVYVPFTNINNYIYDLFGEFIFKHSGTVMIESLLANQNKDKKPSCYVYVTNQQMEVTVIAQKKLILYNCFDFVTKEDFIYYLLFTFEQLQLDTETTKLKLFGAIEEGDAIYEMCYTYIKHLSIFAPSNTSYIIDSKKDYIDFTVLNTL